MITFALVCALSIGVIAAGVLSHFATLDHMLYLLLAAATVIAHIALAYVFTARSGKKSLASAELKIKRQRLNEERSKTYPPFVPNGWYKLCFSDEVKPGQVLEVNALGRLFAVFRGKNDSKVGVLDAYCPHLGANMASHGCVVNDSLQCPFHHWEFGNDGKVACIPYYEGNIPTNANATAYRVNEVYGQVFIWFHSDGADVAPTWELPAVEGIDRGGMVLRGGGVYYRKEINMHIQEWCENGVDFAHFDYVHKKMDMPWFPSIRIAGVEIMHQGRYFFDDANEHISYFEDKAHLKVLGFDLQQYTSAVATIHFIGPGGCIQMHFDIPDLGKIVLFETHTPTGPCVMVRDFLWYADKNIPTFIVWYVIGNWYSQAENDVGIWENKIYLDKPVILKTDGPVNKFRRWYSQFYTLKHKRAERELF